MWHLNKSIWDVQSQGHIGSNKSQTMRFVMTVLSSDLVSHTHNMNTFYILLWQSFTNIYMSYVLPMDKVASLILKQSKNLFSN